MNLNIIISSIDEVISVKYNKDDVVFKDVTITTDIDSKIIDIVNYVKGLTTVDEKVNIALEFIKNNATPEQKLTLIEVYPKWSPGVPYIVGNELQYKGKLYKVIQLHTSQSDWTPDITPALFKIIQPEGVIANFVHPTGSHDTYKLGDKVIFEGKKYESTRNDNSWSPTELPSGWKLI